MTRRTSLLAGVGAVALIGLGVLVWLSASQSAWGAADLYTQAGLTPVRVQAAPPEFVLNTPDGSAISSQALKGRVVLANFWAPWCEPCKEEMPALERLHAALSGERFDLLAITTDTRRKAITGFAKSLGLTFPILLDDDRDVSDALMARASPPPC